jgi:hypothetical protein
MKRILITLAIAALGLFTANAEERTKTYEFKNITGIEAGFTYDIHVTHGRSNVVTIVYDSMYEDYMSVNYYGISGTLCLQMNDLSRKLRNSSHPNIKVYLEMTKVEDIELSGASSITFEGEFSTSELDLDMSGASHLHSLKIKGTSLSADCSGASNSTIEGYFTDDIDVEVSGASELNFYGRANSLEGDISGAGQFEGEFEVETCSIECSGAAAAIIEGSAKKVSLDGSGACGINTRDFIAEIVNVSLSGASKAKVYASKHLRYDVSRTCKMTYYGDAELENISEDSNIVRGR